MRASLMCAVIRPLAFAAAAALLTACQQQQDDTNILVTNEVPPGAEFETLPPDESVATPTDELRNGVDEPPADEAAVNGN